MKPGKRIKYPFFFSYLNCGGNIVKFVLLSHVLPTHLHRSCSLHQSCPRTRQSRCCRLHKTIQCFMWFDNSLSHIRAHHIVTGDLRIADEDYQAWPDISLLRTSRLWIIECLSTHWRRATLTANKPSCWTVQRFDVRTGAVDAVSLSVSLLFSYNNLNFPEALRRPTPK